MGNQQPKVSDVEFGWMAGLFDGEGSALLNIRSKGGKNQGPKIQPCAKCSGTDEVTLSRVISILERAEIAYHAMWYQPKGYMKSGAKYKEAWDITIAGHKRTKRFFQWITPALVTKRERAELLLDYIAERETHSDFRTPITQREVDMALQMRELNRKGGKSKGFDKAVRLNTERPGASSEQLAVNGLKGAQARWGIRN